MPVLGHVGDAGGQPAAGVPADELVPVDDDAARPGRAHAGQRLGQLHLTVAGHSGDADDLAGGHREVQAPQRRHAVVVLDDEVVDDQPGPGPRRRGPGGLGCGLAGLGHRAPAR